MTKKLAKLEMVKIREVWPNEATNFTPWLAEEDNLQLLGDALKMSIELVEREYRVGRFSLDILARNENDNTNIIIENQYGNTNHDHLGKLITYASGCDAKAVVWVTETVLDEHKSAIEWLNENSNEDMSFFLVKVEAYRIGSSPPAPKFEVIVSPNDWTNSIKRNISNAKSLSPLRQDQLEFWQGFKEHLSGVGGFNPPKAYPDNYYPLGTGFSYESKLCLKIRGKDNRLMCYVYLPSRQINLFTFLEKLAPEINKDLGKGIKFVRTGQGTQIEKTLSVGNIFAKAKYPKYYKWLSDQASLFKRTLPMYVAKYKEEDYEDDDNFLTD